ncbi:DNA repair protein RecO, partial [Patescibacteria group bacterium]|nr:DNA repair protein RecO [Patescibacteria group bacterium]MBU1871092.1 DNA repair protein RecO [Patescibacteria group bacterium]
MEKTYRIKAAVLYSRCFGENDVIVTLYTADKGKLELVARGVKKSKSKLAAHLEPISLAEIMVVQGRQYNYIGSAISENCYINLKNNLAKIGAAGNGIRIFNLIVKAGDGDVEIFKILINYWDFLNNVNEESDYDLFVQLFIFKLLIKLGHQPELYHCVICQHRILPANNKFDLIKGGLICYKCAFLNKRKNQLIISENSIKILRLAEKSDFKQLAKVNIANNIKEEIINIIDLFFK